MKEIFTVRAFRINFGMAFFIMVVLTHGALADNSVTLRVNGDTHMQYTACGPSHDSVKFTLTNEGTNTISLSMCGYSGIEKLNNDGKWTKLETESEEGTRCPASFFSLKPGKSTSWSWDQTDSRGNQVPAGKYRGYVVYSAKHAYPVYKEFNILPSNICYRQISQSSNPSSSTISTPKQVSPINGAVFSRYPRTTTLTWSPVPDAASYTIEIDCYHCCESDKWCTDVGKTWSVVPNIRTTSYTFDFVGDQPGRWRVWVVDANGQASAKSDWWNFKHDSACYSNGYTFGYAEGVKACKAGSNRNMYETYQKNKCVKLPYPCCTTQSSLDGYSAGFSQGWRDTHCLY